MANRNPEVKPKDNFKEKHPNYCNFFVDPEPLLKAPPKKAPKLNWKELLSNYQKEKGHPLLPINTKDPESKVPKGSICRVYGAPAEYLYFNDGKKCSQHKCKVCSSLSQVHLRHRKKAKYFCPHCGGGLYLWERGEVSIYKCDNDRCSYFLVNKTKLNFVERLLTKVKSSQFKL